MNFKKIVNFLRLSLYTLSFPFFFIILPLYLRQPPQQLSLGNLIIFYLGNILVLFYFMQKESRVTARLNIETGDLQERINLLTEEISRGEREIVALREKMARYNSLKKIIEDVNQNLSLDYIASELVESAFSIIGLNKGVCLLYLLEDEAQMPLSLFKVKKENPHLVIKAKAGDIFDIWVLKHSRALFIEDIKRDFRFDLNKVSLEEAREVSSLISVPLISNNKFFGILRLDQPQIKAFSEDDLRLLGTISDVGAVAIENARLFQKTQELALHDELTHFFTKGYFLERLKEETAREVREKAGFSLLMLDIDHFKKYNDKFGHIAGDILLKHLSRVILVFTEEFNAILGRFGGEEFSVILPCVEKKKAIDIAEKLRERIEKEGVVLRRVKTSVTVSIGVAHFTSDSDDAEEIIVKADKALYEAKKRGRNCVVSA